MQNAFCNLHVCKNTKIQKCKKCKNTNNAEYMYFYMFYMFCIFAFFAWFAGVHGFEGMCDRGRAAGLGRCVDGKLDVHGRSALHGSRTCTDSRVMGYAEVRVGRAWNRAWQKLLQGCCRGAGREVPASWFPQFNVLRRCAARFRRTCTVPRV